jgi:cytoskeletal protein CcmA (bactofilin family)
MKCRRNKSSRGARLRGSSTAAARADAASAQRHPGGGSPDQPPGPSEGLRRSAELHIDSRTVGAICHDGAVFVGLEGWVTGAITATVIVVEGQVEGNLNAAKSLRIGAVARVVGDLRAPRVVVARGARLQGRLSTRQVSDNAAELDNRGADQVLSGRA